MSAEKPTLRVVIDGVPMPDAEARAFWERFSAWMDTHRGDLVGFAANEGFASVHPGVENGRPVLRVSRTEPQRPYGPAQNRETTGGSGNRHEGRPPDRSRTRKSKKTGSRKV